MGSFPSSFVLGNIFLHVNVFIYRISHLSQFPKGPLVITLSSSSLSHSILHLIAPSYLSHPVPLLSTLHAQLWSSTYTECMNVLILFVCKIPLNFSILNLAIHPVSLSPISPPLCSRITFLPTGISCF